MARGRPPKSSGPPKTAAPESPVVVDVGLEVLPATEPLSESIPILSCSKGMNLSYVKSPENSVVVIEQDDIVDELDYWKTTLVGTVLGRSSTLAQIQSLVLKSWSHITTPEILYFAKGWYYFRFASTEDMEKVRSNVWNLNGYPMVFKPWSPTVVEELNVTHVPVWVLFPGLDPCYWSQTALSKVASVVGNPICADEHTTNKSKLAFARILVNVDLSQELPKAVQLSTPYRGEVLQKIVYEWLPYFCTKCKKIGHTNDRCGIAKPRMEYRKKQAATEKPATVVDNAKPVSVVDKPTHTPPAQHLDGDGFQPNHSKTRVIPRKEIIATNLDNRFQVL
ncbi:uncharacterized protein LOC141641351 [Silene latifolia]|uniref:uncharacterized protein LOC141641351 n=1 Tax=Silene latifolia TaxID=37657 RepID=UPI003D7741D8